MRNTCPQSAICQFCGEEIERFSPRQKWIIKDSSDERCEDSPTKVHIRLGAVTRRED